MTIQMREFGKSTQVHRAFYVPAEKVTVINEGGKETTITKKGTGRMNTKMLGSFKTDKLLAIREDYHNFIIMLEEEGVGLEFDEKGEAWELAKEKIYSMRLERIVAIIERIPKDLNELSMGLKQNSLTVIHFTQEQFDSILNSVDDLKDVIRNTKCIFDETKNIVVKPKKERYC